MEEILQQLVQQIQNKYYGKYRGFVTDNQDPEQLGRVRLRVPSILAAGNTGWALPCMPYGGLADQGLFAVPDVGAQVWVEFEEGELSNPIWTGTFWQAGDIPAEGALTEPTTRVLKTAAGHRLQFDDADGEEQIRLHHTADADLLIDPDGSVTLTDADGATLTLDAAGDQVTLADAGGNTITLTAQGTTIEDANGNVVEMSAAGITVRGQTIVLEGTQVQLGGQGGEPVIKGTSFLTLFATHIHPSAMGPTGPPVPQGEMSSLSTTVKSM